MTHQPDHTPSTSSHVEYALVGGGLQNALVALALRQRQPDARVALIERESRLGGNHVWSFFADDLPTEAREFVDPLVTYRWPGYTVRFPSFSRRLATPYATISSHHLDGEVRRQLGEETVWCGRDVAQVETNRVIFTDGSMLRADVVVDARGPEAPPDSAGVQKFLGLELQFAQPHGRTEPVVMDATVDQTDGFRFVYTLPLDTHRLLVEDTYFTTDPTLDRPRLRHEILDYVRRENLGAHAVVREEEGTLPMPWGGGDLPAFTGRGPLRAGYRGGWFHPATGYSFPISVRVALHVATSPRERLFGPAFQALVRHQRAQARFCRALNRVLFRWFAPRDRWHVFARFYRLSEPTIRRFYALRLTAGDRFSLVVGWPPRGLSLKARLGLGHS